MSVTTSLNVPLPSPPFLSADGVYNLRDIGGYPIGLGTSRSVRRHLVFRGSEPSRITPKGESELHALGIKKIFDIRGPAEIRSAFQPNISPDTPKSNDDTRTAQSEDPKPYLFNVPIKEVEGIERVHLDPTLPEEVANIKAVKQAVNHQKDYKKLPRFTVERFMAKCVETAEHGHAFLPLFQHLSSPSPTPCLIHCTAGKDRTGVLIMILLLHAGCTRATIAHEYSLSNAGLRNEGPALVRELVRNPLIRVDQDTANVMLDANTTFMARLIDWLRDTYGGTDAYLRTVVGLDECEVERLRGNLRAREPPIFGEGEGEGKRDEESGMGWWKWLGSWVWVDS